MLEYLFIEQVLFSTHEPETLLVILISRIFHSNPYLSLIHNGKFPLASVKIKGKLFFWHHHNPLPWNYSVNFSFDPVLFSHLTEDKIKK